MKPPRIVLLPRELADLHAIRALARGDASEEQQRRALRCIIEELSGLYRLSYVSESDRDTSFAEGRRSVGFAIVGIVKLGADEIGRAYKTAMADQPTDNQRRKRK